MGLRNDDGGLKMITAAKKKSAAADSTEPVFLFLGCALIFVCETDSTQPVSLSRFLAHHPRRGANVRYEEHARRVVCYFFAQEKISVTKVPRLSLRRHLSTVTQVVKIRAK